MYFFLISLQAVLTTGLYKCDTNAILLSLSFPWLLSIMPNRPVREKWNYPRKMERHFPIKPRQLIRNSSCHFLSFPNSLVRAKNRFVKNGTANFDRNIPTEISGPPPKVISNIPVGRNRNGPFHLNSDRNFRNLWHNGKHPISPFFPRPPLISPSISYPSACSLTFLINITKEKRLLWFLRTSFAQELDKKTPLIGERYRDLFGHS